MVEVLSACKKSSFEAEYHSYHGISDTILEKLPDVDNKLTDRRAFGFVIESDKGAELEFYERIFPNTYNVTSLTGNKVGEISKKIYDAIFANKGIQCVGEVCKNIISENNDIEKHENIPGPVTGISATRHGIRRNADPNDYLRVSVILLC